ncbi:MAG: class I SAM-dependent methyltransferase [Deltaproteobacteria bacterium]|nr:class I SAM-dependent methyltransferase [Deltaproteobacteria bacterium]
MSVAERLAAAIARRGPLLARLAAEDTDCVRLLHGVAEGAPGITIDRYGPILLVQTWRAPLAAGELDALVAVARDALGVALTPCWNHRGEGPGGSARADQALVAPIAHELGLAYDVRPRHRGQDPLLFLDLRVGRRWVKGASADRSVLNLFAYTCGMGVAALAGGAREVVNVDFARSALAVGRANAERNVDDPATLAERFVTITDDVIPVVRQLAGLTLPTRGKRARAFTRRAPRRFDLVVLDPPRWAKGKFGAVDVVRDYASLFKPALLATAPGGTVLATNHVPEVGREVWLAALERSAAKAGRPLAALDVLTPEEDFPSPDERHPLKIALARAP